ncbi:hypothetical protein PUNSTDRAFT_130301 [Punctularia strigosozonata HHB-11173 SS5]|uniref:uncharacterized protein n=1 Tax=Punctularia strigosozonata (strain HHB-11173) TaxID=741275 RepID=UPI0004417E86|nr:uncharacterized protein PUNSTDRAFT_130301 [Punctularia strigosozonata HHB-11173 SS5]EIN14676.1 hypothetical protein PUNSTDRAFT_130301 [Punctularia strigosozonata HHB-11173 SS5]
MEDKRAQTLDALEAYIQTQTALLQRTLSDIESLKNLRREIQSSTGTDALELVSQRAHDDSMRLSARTDCIGTVPEGIRWDAFKNRDLAPVRAVATAHAEETNRLNNPSAPQSSPSSLQLLVRSSRTALLDPVLSGLHITPPSSDEEEDPAEAAERLRKEIERQKIRELKQRRLFGEHSGGGLRPRGPSGVYVRRDVEDESGEVDIGIDAKDGVDPTGGSAPDGDAMQVDETTPSVGTARQHGRTDTVPLQAVTAPSVPVPAARTRRPTKKAEPPSYPTTFKRGQPKPPSTTTKQKVKVESDSVLEDADTDVDGAQKDPESEAQTNSKAKGKFKTNNKTEKPGKPKPETYKQAWSVEEQHELERLLEEIPAGEKNRWQKISRAMNGRRTPRQVASRVQKYFEKLKKFGIDADGVGR